MAIKDRNLKPGTVLEARYKGVDYTCKVGSKNGKLVYRLGDGEFASPSSAGSHIRSGKATNGWAFWSPQGTRQAKERARAAAPKAKANPNGNGNGRVIRPLGDGRFFCSACQEAFDAPKDVEPQGCPQGHSPQSDPVTA